MERRKHPLLERLLERLLHLERQQIETIQAQSTEIGPKLGRCLQGHANLFRTMLCGRPSLTLPVGWSRDGR
jgi:hypothetical protein